MSARLFAWISASTGRILMKFDIGLFSENLWSKTDKNKGYFHVCSHGFRLPLDGFSWNLILDCFSKICREKLTRITGTLHEDQCALFIISRRSLLRIRNVSDQSFRENQNARFMFSNFLSKNIVVCETMWIKCGRAKQATDGNTAHAMCMFSNYGYIHTQNFFFLLNRAFR
jgi:hypothetical protein